MCTFSRFSRSVSTLLPAVGATVTHLDRLRSFLLVAPHIGFFFHIPRFLDAFKRSMPPTRTSPIPPALVFSVLLLDSVFGDSHDRKFVEPQLLAMALQHLSSDLDPSRILYTLQAEVLISLYLLHQNRRLGASYHVSAAVSIAVACGLHKICSASPFVGPQLAIMLPLAIDAIEEGERIRAFWTVYILDRGWTMCTYASSALLDEDSMLSQIDTPWPMELHEYEKVDIMCMDDRVFADHPIAFIDHHVWSADGFTNRPAVPRPSHTGRGTWPEYPLASGEGINIVREICTPFH